jgi:ketosteroid isomerase-like protein
MSDRSNAAVVLDLLDAVETRDVARLAALYHPEIEFHWPPGLPYGGVHRGAEVARMNEQFASIWLPLQPTAAERSMDGEIIAAEGEHVVAKHTWKGCDWAGRWFCTETLAHYQLRDGKLLRAQMYHFDLKGLLDFLAAARRGEVRP